MVTWFRRMERQWVLLSPTSFLLTDVMISKRGEEVGCS